MVTGGIAFVGGSPAEAACLGAYPLAPVEVAAASPDLLLIAAARYAEVATMPMPVMVVDAPADAATRAALLDAGAADLVPAGIDPLELAARVRAILRRGGTVRCGDLTVDLIERRAARHGRPIALHPREFAILAELARHRDKEVSRRSLYAAVWQRHFDPGSNVVAVTISRLRARIGPSSSTLIRTTARGYMLSAVAGG